LRRGIQHKVRAGGRTCYYYQIERGTARAGKRVRLPNDPRTPEFWTALRQAQGIAKKDGGGNTIHTLIDAYMASDKYTKKSAGTQAQYRGAIQVVHDVWGELHPDEVGPTHVQKLMDTLASTPQKANTVLTIIRNISNFGIKRQGFNKRSLCEGVERNECEGGHKPWTEAQIEAALTKLTGVVRKGILLYLYTGQRGSDVVRIGWTDVDENGFRCIQRKTRREVWCPILPELEEEMRTWKKHLGPFLQREDGTTFSRETFSNAFDRQRAKIPELKDVTLHGLRATAVIRLRMEGLSNGQIGDISGMSLATIERYCRFADRKLSGQAALLQIKRNRTRIEQDCKILENCKR
jgi:hypothetical protein